MNSSDKLTRKIIEYVESMGLKKISCNIIENEKICKLMSPVCLYDISKCINFDNFTDDGYNYIRKVYLIQIKFIKYIEYMTSADTSLGKLMRRYGISQPINIRNGVVKWIEEFKYLPFETMFGPLVDIDDLLQTSFLAIQISSIFVSTARQDITKCILGRVNACNSGDNSLEEIINAVNPLRSPN